MPMAAEGKDFPDVPGEIASMADEAHRCASIGAYRAAIMSARAVVEATCKEHGIVDGTLYTKIEKLHAAGKIGPLVKDEVTEIRLMGNDMAHGDLGEAPTGDDAGECLAYMAELLEEVYQRPARVEARAAKRAGSS